MLEPQHIYGLLVNPKPLERLRSYSIGEVGISAIDRIK